MKKQRDLTLRYWSPRHNEIWTLFYISPFCGHDECDKISEKMYNKMLGDDIPMDKKATLIWDGPGMNKILF